MSTPKSFLATALIVDASLAFIATLAFLFLNSFSYLNDFNPLAIALLTAVLSAAVLLALKTSKYIWRFVSHLDFLPFAKAAGLVVVSEYAILLTLYPPDATALTSYSFAGQVLGHGTLHTLLLSATWLGVRLVWRTMQDAVDYQQSTAEPPRRVLLVSADVECAHLLRGLESAENRSIEPVGILDFDRRKVGRVVRGVGILGTPDELESVIKDLASKGLRPQEVVLTAKLPELVMLDVIERTVAARIKISKLSTPGETSELIRKGLSPTLPITLQAIGGREPFEFDREPIANLVTGRRILVTGAGGSIGSQLVELISSFSPMNLCLVDNCEFNLWKIGQLIEERFPQVEFESRLTDIRDVNRLRQVFMEVRPDLVFHAAALKHVPMVEANPSEGVLTNIIGTMNVVDVALDSNVEAMVQVSTDKAVMPTSVMGATKRVAEMYCQALDVAQTGPRFMTVRFGNVLGSSGSVVPVFEKQISKGGPVTVTHPMMERYFMTIAEACELILHSAAHGARDANARGVINVLDMGEPVKILDVARRIILLHGLRPGEDIEINFTGIRPGEKLVENLFNDNETPLESSVVGVHTALSESTPLAEVRLKIERLHHLAIAGDDIGIRSELQKIVPGYSAEDGINKSSEAA